MKRTARILSVLLAVAMLFALAACASEKTDKNDSDDNGKTKTEKYVIYSDNSFPPFEYYDEASGKYVGVDMDLLAAIAEDQGFEYEMHNEGFDAAMGAVQSGQANAMIAGMTIREDRLENFDFSDGYFEDGSIMVVAADSSVSSLEDLRGKTVAAKKGTVSTDYAVSIKDEYGFEITYFEDSPTMYQAVITGTTVACFEDYSVIGWAIKNGDVAMKTVGDVVNPGQYGFAVKKNTNAELIEKFNKGLANLKSSGKYDEILEKYGY